MREIALAIEGGYKYYYMGEPQSALSLSDLRLTDRLLHSFVYQDALQESISTVLYLRLVDRLQVLSIVGLSPTNQTDPETYAWDRLDADILNRLSARKYVSMSVERQLRLPPTKVTSIEELGLNNDELTRYHRYQQQQNPFGTRHRGEHISAFTVGMPGIMSLAQVQSEIPLGRWMVKIRNNMFVHLDVSEAPSVDQH